MIDFCKVCANFQIDTFSDKFGFCWLHRKDVKNHDSCQDWTVYRSNKPPSLPHTLEEVLIYEEIT